MGPMGALGPWILARTACFGPGPRCSCVETTQGFVSRPHKGHGARARARAMGPGPGPGAHGAQGPGAQGAHGTPGPRWGAAPGAPWAPWAHGPWAPWPGPHAPWPCLGPMALVWPGHKALCCFHTRNTFLQAQNRSVRARIRALGRQRAQPDPYCQENAAPIAEGGPTTSRIKIFDFCLCSFC